MPGSISKARGPVCLETAAVACVGGHVIARPSLLAQVELGRRGPEQFPDDPVSLPWAGTFSPRQHVRTYVRTYVVIIIALRC